jgi:hypothetical protein
LGHDRYGPYEDFIKRKFSNGVKLAAEYKKQNLMHKIEKRLERIIKFTYK